MVKVRQFLATVSHLLALFEARPIAATTARSVSVSIRLLAVSQYHANGEILPMRACSLSLSLSLSFFFECTRAYSI